MYENLGTVKKYSTPSLSSQTKWEHEKLSLDSHRKLEGASTFFLTSSPRLWSSEETEKYKAFFSHLVSFNCQNPKLLITEIQP